MRISRVNAVIVLLFIGILLLPIGIPFGYSGQTATAIDNAIERGLAYLAANQSSDGSWSWSGNYPVATTAMTVLAFENAPHSHLPDNMSDPYHTNVAKGLDYLFTQAHVQQLSNKSYGTPDTNHNGIGIDFYSSSLGWPHYEDTGYQTPMVLMAIIASQNQSRIATTGPAGAVNRTYRDIAVDIVDWLAWAQNDNSTGTNQGGWRYVANFGSSDNSVSQWPIIGLLAAELWGINAPTGVKTLLTKWLNVSQTLTGNYSSNYFYGAFDYTPNAGYYSVVESATGILGLTYLGVPASDPRIRAAEGFIVREWNTTQGPGGWRNNMGDLYAMYGIMKAMRLTLPNATRYIENYTGAPLVEWYNGTGTYADWLVTSQYPNGRWSSTNMDEDQGAYLDTAFGTLILEFVPVKVKWNLAVKVVDASTSNPVSGANVTIVGPETHWNMTDDGAAVFDKIQAGNYTVTASKAGYASNSTWVFLDANKTITIPLTPLTRLARIEICPETLNLKSEGRWITCFIWLPKGYDVHNINVSSILLNNTIPAEHRPVYLGHGLLMIKFDREKVEALILSHGVKYGKATLTVNFRLKNGTAFQGSDTIRVRMPRVCRDDDYRR